MAENAGSDEHEKRSKIKLNEDDYAMKDRRYVHTATKGQRDHYYRLVISFLFYHIFSGHVFYWYTSLIHFHYHQVSCTSIENNDTISLQIPRDSIRNRFEEMN